MVQTGFTRKRVQSLTLGEKLKKLRGDYHMSLQEVSRSTRIQVKYLEYLENGEYDKLPADVYVRGFLRSYARYLNIDEQVFIKLYERERNIQENLGRDTKPVFEKKSFSPFSLVITPRALVLCLIVLLVGGAFFYLYKEFKSFAAVPRLVISEPQSGAVVDTSEITVRGKTDKGAQVTINGQAVFVGNEGEFSDTLILQPGMNAVTVTAVNRFDKEKSETFSIEAHYAVTQAPVPSSVEDSFHVEVSAKSAEVKLIVQADNQEVFNGVLAANETKIFEAKESLSVMSNRPEMTWVRFNDQEQAVLGKKGTPVTVTFDKSGRQK